MSKVFLLHGFNVHDGGYNTVGTLYLGLASNGHKVTELKYGHVGRFKVRTCNDTIAHMVAGISHANPGSSIIAHSNGAAIVHKAGKLGAQWDNVFLINPALDEDKPIVGAASISVFYAPSDPWTRVAKWIPFSPWGRQGQVGYTGEDFRHLYTQWNLDQLTRSEVGHSGIFLPSQGRRDLLSIINGKIAGVSND